MTAVQILCEAISLNEAVVNTEARTVDVVLIRPGWSANGRYYGPAVLAKAARLFENVKAYADHPTREALKRGEGRSVRDITGAYTHVRIGEGGELRATRKVFETPAGNAVWPLIVASIGSPAPVIGLSINAVGRAVEGKAPDGREGIIIEDIHAANSVDDVTEPAAGGGFVALTAGHDDLAADVLSAMDAHEILSLRPDLRDAVKGLRIGEALEDKKAELVAAQQGWRVTEQQLIDAQAAKTALIEERDALQSQLARAKLEAAVEKAFRAAGLPATLEREIREQLDEAPPDKWLGILDREKRKAASMGVKRDPVPVTGAGRREGSPLVMTEALARGPIDMSRIASPEQLAAELKRLQGA